MSDTDTQQQQDEPQPPRPQDAGEAEPSPVDGELKPGGDGPFAWIPPNPQAALTAALAAAQGEFPPIAKGKTAVVKSQKGDYSYSYADLADVLAAVRPVLSAHGLALVQRTRHLENGTVELATELRHVAGGMLDSIVEVSQSPGNHQQFGGALSYLRRYEIVTLLGIAAEEDLDGQQVEPTNGRRQQQAEPELPGWALKANDDQRKEVADALTRLIGEERARQLGAATRQSCGGIVPGIVVGFTKALTAHIEALAQDRRAEQPDQPTPEGAIPVGNGGLSAALAQAKERGDESDVPADTAGLDPDSEPVEPDPGALEESARRAELPPQGTINLDGDIAMLRQQLDAPDDMDDDAVRAAARELCVCPQGMDTPPDQVDDACPILGHGIPF